MGKPSVNTNPVANQYSSNNERIIEFNNGEDGTGGLMSLRRQDDGTLQVRLYRLDAKVEVLLPVSYNQTQP